MINKDRRTDKIIRKSLKNIEVPKEIFEEAYEKLGLKEEYQEVQKNKKRIKVEKQVLEYAACIVLIVIVSLSAFALVKCQNCTAKNDNIEQPILEVGELPVATVVINELEGSENKNLFVSPIGKQELIKESEFIAIVRLNKIKKYFNYIIKKDAYSSTPLTLAEYEIVKNYKGELSGNVDIVTYGGVITLSEYEKTCSNSMLKKLGLDKISDKEKRITFVEVSNYYTKYSPKLKQDKHYLMYFNYNNELEEYKVVESAIYEFNMDDSAILNTETNEWESFEFINQ